jgi:hypothetical protein
MNRYNRIEREEMVPHRGRIVVPALLFSAAAAVTGAVTLLALYKIAGGQGGYVVMLTIFGLIALLTGYHARLYLLDLGAEPVTLEGEVRRKWHKGNVLFFFVPSFYVHVSDSNYLRLEEEGKKVWNKIFSVRREEYAMLLETDLVRVTCYPHSLTIERLERYDETDKAFIPAASGAAG